MDKYELVVIVDAAIPQEQKDSIVKESCEAITKNKGKVINSQVWLDKQRFSFPMKKRTEGTYFVINFESLRSVIAKLRPALKLNEGILRSLIVKVD